MVYMSEYIPVEKLNYSFYKWIHISKDLEDLCYVGSTANITRRKQEHKCCCNNPNHKQHNKLLYEKMREYGGFENFKMVILGTAEQITKREAQAIEEQYRVAERATLNKYRCYIADEQKIERKIECDNKYRQNHKERIAERRKQYDQEHKEEKAEYSVQYRQDHKEEIAERNKQYRQNHKEKIAEHKKQYYLKQKALQTQAEEAI